MISISVDESRCEGHGVCQDLAPEVFSVDDEGMVHLLQDPVPAALGLKAAGGARGCPVAALTVTGA